MAGEFIEKNGQLYNKEKFEKIQQDLEFLVTMALDHKLDKTEDKYNDFLNALENVTFEQIYGPGYNSF